MIKTVISLTVVMLITGCGVQDYIVDYWECPADETLKSEMLVKINEARSEPRYCGDEYFEAVQIVTWNDRLETAAKGHSDDMASNNFFEHDGSNGASVGERISTAGYDWRYYNENIAAGGDSATDVVDRWLKSPGHCQNIMTEKIAEIGAACSDNRQSHYETYWTLDGGYQK